MSVVEPGSTRSGLIERVKAILLRPTPTWEVIDAEPATVGGLYKGYIAPLAAVPAVCMAIGQLVFGIGGFGVTYRPPIGSVIAGAIVQYVLSLLSVYLLALIINALAPSFGGQKNQIQALKVAAYSSTASWLAGVFMIWPLLAILSLLGLYSLYLLYKGLPRLMRTPEDKAVPYIAVIIIAGVVLTIVVSAIAAPIMRMGGGGGIYADNGRVEGKLKVGDTEVDLGKLEAASKQLEAAAKQMEAAAEGQGAAAGAATDPEVLKAALHAAVGAFTRTELSTGAGNMGAMGGSSAEGIYTRGDSRFTLSVTDVAAAGALAGLASAFNVESSSESDGRYEKVGRVDGRMTTEEYDRNARRGSYGVLVADRFMVQAEGEGVTIDELKAAVGAVNPARLESLAKG